MQQIIKFSSTDNCPYCYAFLCIITTSALDCWKNYTPNTLPNNTRLLSEWVNGRMKDH